MNDGSSVVGTGRGSNVVLDVNVLCVLVRSYHRNIAITQVERVANNDVFVGGLVDTPVDRVDSPGEIWCTVLSENVTSHNTT